MIKQALKVFSFTFRRHVSQKSYISLTVILAAILLIAIPLIMGLVSHGESESYSAPAVSRAVVVDCPGSESVDWSFVEQIYPLLETVKARDLEEAQSLAAEDPRSVIVLFTLEDGLIRELTLLPPGSALEMDSAEGLTAVLSSALPAAASEDPERSFEAINAGVDVVLEDLPEDVEEEEDSLRFAMGFAVSYIIIMVMYFMLLGYGQNTAAGLVLEKSSKLMDMFLVSVRPLSVVMGKVTALVAAAILQVLIWAAGAFGGFAIGMVRAGQSQMMGVFIEALKGMFTPGAVILALLIAAVGVLLYCSVSAFGGALASRSEDLSSTNAIFTLVLIASFMVTLFTGVLTGQGEAPRWSYYVPFTAVFTAPGALLLGRLSLLQGAASLVICAAATVAVLYIASRAYVMMVFYKGKVPNPKEVLSLIFGGKASSQS